MGGVATERRTLPKYGKIPKPETDAKTTAKPLVLRPEELNFGFSSVTIKATDSNDGIKPAATQEELSSEIEASDTDDGYSTDASLFRRIAAKRAIDEDRIGH